MIILKFCDRSWVGVKNSKARKTEQISVFATMDDLLQRQTTYADRCAERDAVIYAPMKIQKDFTMNNQSRQLGYFPASFFRRTDRLVLDDTGYHYRVRKGETIGPFSCEKEAASDLNSFIKQLATENSFSNAQS